jgi:hypothetical protein
LLGVFPAPRRTADFIAREQKRWGEMIEEVGLQPQSFQLKIATKTDAKTVLRCGEVCGSRKVD